MRTALCAAAACLLITSPASAQTPDITPPVTDISFSTPNYQSGDRLYISTRTDITLTAVDPVVEGALTSGVKVTVYFDGVFIPGVSTPAVYSGPFQLSEGTHTLIYVSLDNAGSTETPKMREILVDGTGPEARLALNGLALDPGASFYMPVGGRLELLSWDPGYNGPASGVSDMLYIADLAMPPQECFSMPYISTAPPGTCSNPRYAGPFTLSTAGVHTVLYLGMDNVHNFGGGMSQAEVVQAPNDPPAQINGVPLGVSSVSWSWTPVDYAAGYRVYAHGSDQLLAAVGEPQYIMEGLTVNSRAGVCVSAYNQYYEAQRNCGYVYTLAAPPGTPYAAWRSSHSLYFTWDMGGNPPGHTGTAIELSTDNFADNISVLDANGYAYRLAAGLAPGTLYYARVRAANGDNIHSAYSPVFSTSTLAAPPDAPINPASFLDIPSKTISLFWQPAASGEPAALFRIYRRENDGQFMFRASTAAAYFEDRITASGTYYYLITAVNGEGLEGAPAGPLAVYADITPPGAAEDLALLQFVPETRSAVFVFGVPYDNSGIDHYEFRSAASEMSGGDWPAAAFVSSVPASAPYGSSQTVSLVLDSTAAVRFFALKAFDAAGNASAVSNSVPVDPVPPAVSMTPPFEPGAAVGRPFQAQVSASDNYRLARLDFLADDIVVSSVTIQNTSYNAPFLWNIPLWFDSDGSHSIAVRAYDLTGNYAERRVPLLVNYAPPPAPSIISPADNFAINASTINVSGTAEPGVFAAIFVNGAFAASADVTQAGTFHAAGVPLGGDGAVSITAQAVDPRGSSPSSRVVPGVVDTGPPLPPEISAAASAGGKITLSWAAPSGEVPASYSIYRAASEEVLIAGAQPSGTPLASGLKTLEFSDYPPADAVYYYAIASVDAAHNISVLSNAASAAADRSAPSASVALPGRVPPLGAGSYALELTVSELLAATPYLVFTPAGGSPRQIALSVSASPYIWTGTFTVTQEMASGSGRFSFQGTDFTGNAGRVLSAGALLALNTTGPAATLSFVPASGPELKTGTYPITLLLDKPAAAVPALAYSTGAGGIAIILSSSADAGIWTGALSVDAAIGEGPHNFSYSAADSLGNTGTLLGGSTYFITDTVSPGAPLNLHWSAAAGGRIDLSWSAPLSGETPYRYCVYRDGGRLGCEVVPSADLTGRFGEVPADGPHDYYVSAMDKAGNEGPASGTAAALPDSMPPAAPALNEPIITGAEVDLSWTPGSGDSIGFRLYRSTYTLSSLAGAQFRALTGGSYPDIPQLDGVYHYILTALDAAGNESPPSQEKIIQYDAAPPLITINGAADGGVYGSAVQPVFSAQDLNLSGVSAALDGAPFDSGSIVSAEGAHTLVVASTDTLGHAASKTVQFSIDLTSPVINLSGVGAGGVYTSALTPAISVTDPHLSTFSISLNGAAYAPGTPISVNGSYSLAITAADLAGNVSHISTDFALDTPPLKLQSLKAVIEGDSALALSWAANPAAAGYKIFKDGVYLAPVPADGTDFRDTGYSPVSAHVYEIAVIDSKGREGVRTRAEIPAVSFLLSGYGNYVSQAQALNRGFFDTVRFSLTNNGSQALTAGPLMLSVDGLDNAQAAAVVVPAGSTGELAPVVYTATTAAAALSGKAELALSGGGDAALSAVRTFTLSARDPVQPVMEVYPEALVRGMYSAVRLKFNNRGSAPLDVVTARLSGSDQAASKTAMVRLKTPDGLLLSQAELSQTSGTVITRLNDEQVYFISIPAGGSLTFDPLRPAVPQDTEQSLVVEGLIGGPSGTAGGSSGLAYSLPGAAKFLPGVFSGSRTAATVPSVPYSLTLQADKARYDSGSTVTLGGYYSDTWNNPLRGRPVAMTISNKGYQRTLQAVSGQDGYFTARFFPAPGESGVYEASARHPDFAGEAAHSSFSVTGMEFGWSDYSLTMARGSAYSFEAEFSNTGETPLEGLNAAVDPVSGSGVTAAPVTVPSSIPAGAKRKLALSFYAADGASDAAEFLLAVSDANGFTRKLPIHIKTAPAQVIPRLSPAVLELGMLAGDTRSQTVTVENIGFSTWTGAQITQPVLSWVRIDAPPAGPVDVPPGGKFSFTLVFEPPAGLPNGGYARNPLLTITGGGAAPAPLNAGIAVTASRQGDLLFNVASADVPKESAAGRIGGADLRLTSLDIAGLALSARTDSNGLAGFEGVPAGRYVYKAEAGGYNAVTGSVVVEPGLARTIDVFMPTAMVAYKWSVTPTAIQDKYDIKLDMTVRTDVPAPALVMDPPNIALDMKGGETAYAQFTIRNKGLVSAFDLKTEITGDSALHIETPIQRIEELKAGQSAVVPVKITLDHASSHEGSVCMSGYYSAVCEQSTVTVCGPVRSGDIGGGTSPYTPVYGQPHDSGGPGCPYNQVCGWRPVERFGASSVKKCSMPGGSGVGAAGGYTRQGNRCGGVDPLTGNNPEFLPGIPLPPASIPPHYRLRYDSYENSVSPDGLWELEPQADGSLLVDFPDGSVVRFVPDANIVAGVSGNSPQFGHVPGVPFVAFSSGDEGYSLVGKDGTVIAFARGERYAKNVTGGPPPVFYRYALSGISEPKGSSLGYQYDAEDNGEFYDSHYKLSRITDSHNRTIDITYVPKNDPAPGEFLYNVRTVTDFTGRQVTYNYDASNRLISADDMDGSQTRYGYNAQGRMSSVEYPNGAHKTITYDGGNRVLSVAEDGDNNKETYAYEEAAAKTTVTDALGRQTAYEYVTVAGRKEITKITAPDNSVTRFGYDSDLNKTFIADALSRDTTMTYDNRGNMLSLRDPLGNTTRMDYTSDFNQVSAITDPKGNITRMTYDLRGNLTEVSDALGHRSRMSYDALGHVTAAQDPLGNVSAFEYGGLGALSKITDPLGRATLMTRDNLSRVTQTTDPKGKSTLFDYSVKGNLTKVTDALNGITEYGYTGGCPSCGGGDLLASVKDARNQQTTFSYDLQKRLTGVSNPLGQSKGFVYDKKGNLTSVTDAKGQTISFEYDVNDRLTVKHLPEGAVTYTYDLVGNLLSVISPDSAVTMTYDALNRVISTEQRYPLYASPYAFSYAYDANGNRTRMTTPWGVTNYSYDALNRLVSLTNPDNKTITFSYDALGRRTKMTMPNGTETTYAYDAGSQLTQVAHRKVSDNSAIAFANYSYDLAGNRTSMTDMAGTHNYGYDDLHRLVSAGHPGGTALLLKDENFAYDPVGNRTSDAVMTNYQHNAANRLLENSSYTYEYDLNGNLTGQTAKTDSTHTAYVYNSENQLVSATMPDGTIATYKYDPLGRRLEKDVVLDTVRSTLRYVYDNEDIIAVLDGNNNLIANITHGPSIDEPLIMKSSASANYYYHADGLGSITALTNDAGNVAETIEYQAYGKPVFKDASGTRIARSALGNPYSYTAREYDDETGLFYYRARYYSAGMGRFLQEDKELYFETKNLYEYVKNNPLNFLDVNGDRPMPPPFPGALARPNPNRLQLLEALFKTCNSMKDSIYNFKLLDQLNNALLRAEYKVPEGIIVTGKVCAKNGTGLLGEISLPRPYGGGLEILRDNETRCVLIQIRGKKLP